MPSFRTILVPVDFTGSCRAALDLALGVAGAYGARVVMLHAWKWPAYGFGRGEPDRSIAEAAFAQTAAELKKKLAAFAADAKIPAGVTLDVQASYGAPADVILAAGSGADLIVMGTHGRSGLPRLVMGSVASKVIQRASCPVLTVREPAPSPSFEEKEIVVYALFERPEQMEEAYRKLVESGFSMEDVSFLMTEETRDRSFQNLEQSETLKGAATGSVFGGAVGGILGGLTALGTASGIGLLVMGPMLAFAAAGGLFGGLIGRGVPKEQARRLQDALHRGQALLAVHVREEHMQARAEEVLKRFGGDTFELSGLS